MSTTKPIETLHVFNLNDFIEPDMEKNVVNGNMTFKLFYEIFGIERTPMEFDVAGFFCNSLASRVQTLYKYNVRDNVDNQMQSAIAVERVAVEKFIAEMRTMGECNSRAMVMIASRYFVENKL